MQKTINIGGKDTLCTCNALTPYLYTQIFRKDFLTQIMGFRNMAGKTAETINDNDVSEISKRTAAFAEMAFVFAKQAEIKTAAELVKLTEIDFYNWLANFEQGAFMNAETMTEILSLWQGNTAGTTESKNA